MKVAGSSSLLSTALLSAALLLAACTVAASSPQAARAADSLTVRSYSDKAREYRDPQSDGSTVVTLAEELKLKGQMLLEDTSVSKVLSNPTRIRLVLSWDYRPTLDSENVTQPISFTMGDCQVRGDEARLTQWGVLRGKRVLIAQHVILVEQQGKDVRLGFVLSCGYQLYFKMDADGHVVTSRYVGDSATGMMLCGFETQSVIGEGELALVVRPGGGTKHTATQRLYLATEIARSETATKVTIVGVPGVQ